MEDVFIAEDAGLFAQEDGPLKEQGGLLVDDYGGLDLKNGALKMETVELKNHALVKNVQ